MNTLVVGLLRGDEGKGKITDYLANNHDVVVRYAGGPNAGHSIYRNNKLFVTHMIPSGIFSKKICIIGRGCVVNLNKLYKFHSQPPFFQNSPTLFPGTGLTPETCLVILRHKAFSCEAI